MINFLFFRSFPLKISLLFLKAFGHFDRDRVHHSRSTSSSHSHIRCRPDLAGMHALIECGSSVVECEREGGKYDLFIYVFIY